MSMLPLNQLVFASVAFVVVTFVVGSVWALFRATRRQRRVSRSESTPVSVLKPLCGADDQLESNLETFFRQTHQAYEIVFGVEGSDDPAAAVVRRLRARYPEVRARLVVHDGGRALNPKVSNLRAILEAGTHDVVVISDSNVAVTPDYVQRMLGQLAEPGVGLVTSLFCGRGERSLGARVEALHLAGSVTTAVALSQETSGEVAAVGKSMMFRRSTLVPLGGLEAVGRVLAEDYVLGKMFASAGYRVRLCGGVVDNVAVSTSCRRFFDRQLRWGLIRSRLSPALYALEPLSNPMLLALVAPLLGIAGWAPLMLALCLTFARDALAWRRLRGDWEGLSDALPLGPLKDVAMLGVWLIAPFLRHVAWRGKRYRVAMGTRLYASAPQDAPTPLRFE